MTLCEYCNIGNGNFVKHKERSGIMSEKKLSEELRHCLDAIKCIGCDHECENIETTEICTNLLQKAYEKIKEYEELEEQGKLLKLPCEIGQTVYMLYHLCEEAAWEIEEHKIRLEDIENIGKTVFLTREEAEAALWINKMSRKCSEETFEWLTYRAKEYVNFLICNAPKKDKAEWNYRFIAALKFLGDYSLEDELKEFETRR